MSKELTPLEALEKIKDIIREDGEDIDNPRFLVDELSIIETALQDNYFYKYMINKICDFMGLDINPFEDLVNTENEMINYIYENECFRVDVATNKNKLKAFEIIKKKRVNVHLLILSDSLEKYNFNLLPYRKLTQEEYDLLKEVLL